jgi:cytochrome c
MSAINARALCLLMGGDIGIGEEMTADLGATNEMLRLALLTALAFASLPASSWAQDSANGEKVFKKCAACHAVGEAAKNKVGPLLNEIVGRPAGQIEGFKYSKAMLESSLVWDEAALTTYLHDPKSVVKGTKMAFAGLKKDDEIADVIAYLKGFGANGTPQ